MAKKKNVEVPELLTPLVEFDNIETVIEPVENQQDINNEQVEDVQTQPEIKDEQPIVENKQPEKVVEVSQKNISEVVTSQVVEVVKASKGEKNSDSKFPIGVAYIHKCLSGVPDLVSKYSVRIVTEGGFREIRKTSKDKAKAIATSYNREKGINSNIIFED